MKNCIILIYIQLNIKRNIFVNDESLVIGDLALTNKGDELKKKSESLYYMSPELLSNENISHSTDIW